MTFGISMQYYTDFHSPLFSCFQSTSRIHAIVENNTSLFLSSIVHSLEKHMLFVFSDSLPLHEFNSLQSTWPKSKSIFLNQKPHFLNQQSEVKKYEHRQNQWPRRRRDCRIIHYQKLKCFIPAVCCSTPMEDPGLFADKCLANSIYSDSYLLTKHCLTFQYWVIIWLFIQIFIWFGCNMLLVRRQCLIIDFSNWSFVGFYIWSRGRKDGEKTCFVWFIY